MMRVAGTQIYVPPPGISLLFCSGAEIAAAPAAEREAYYAIVEAIIANPESCGLRQETGFDLDAEHQIDRRLAAANQDWAR